MIVRAVVVALALLTIAGCKKSTPTPAEAAIAKLIEFRDRACNCTELKCVRLAQKELADWLLANSAELGKLKFTPAQDAAGQKSSVEMNRCVAKMEQSVAPAPP